MRKFDLKKRIGAGSSETVLGAKDLGTHACYLIYGKLIKGEPPATLKAGKGHEEIVCVVSGKMSIDNGTGPHEVSEGEAFHLVGEESYLAKPVAETAAYVIAGGHSAGGGHNH